ncbi:MerR family transcriptional regulator [Nocardia sp. JMUB6875]|uniref:MerR family transcriptional regulator n=1 Tax=Nocardia sp. JMUB6875 TaxID=3158170 RepID=UPI0032E6B1F8
MSPRPTITPDQAGYSVRVVAERLGIPTATLRSWNRRYGIGPRQDRPGRHRLYSEGDIAALVRMRELLDTGMSAAAAAAAIRGPALPRGDRAVLLAAAFALDEQLVCGLLEQHVRAHGVVETWNGLCRPAFAEVVDRQLGGDRCIDVEHLLSWCLIATLHRLTPPVPSHPAPTLVLACTSGETHSLPLEVLHAALSERGIGARMLGPDVPTEALSATLDRMPAPATVMLWSQREATALTSAVRACLAADARVNVGGDGWQDVLLPDSVVRLTSLTDAVERLAHPAAR